MSLNRVTPGHDVPLDINVIIEIPANSDPVKYEVDKDSGADIRCRPLGMLQMHDEAGEDAKLLAVPIDALSDRYRHMASVRDMPPSLLSQIAHFFEHYKDLEPGKWVRIDGWAGAEEAKAEVVSGVERYNQSPQKPAF